MEPRHQFITVDFMVQFSKILSETFGKLKQECDYYAQKMIEQQRSNINASCSISSLSESMTEKKRRILSRKKKSVTKRKEVEKSEQILEQRDSKVSNISIRMPQLTNPRSQPESITRKSTQTRKKTEKIIEKESSETKKKGNKTQKISEKNILGQVEESQKEPDDQAKQGFKQTKRKDLKKLTKSLDGKQTSKSEKKAYERQNYELRSKNRSRIEISIDSDSDENRQGNKHLQQLDKSQSNEIIGQLNKDKSEAFDRKACRESKKKTGKSLRKQKKAKLKRARLVEILQGNECRQISSEISGKEKPHSQVQVESRSLIENLQEQNSSSPSKKPYQSVQD